MIPKLSDSPRPVPCPDGFVVKNGSKIRSWMSGGIPGPVSPHRELDPRTAWRRPRRESQRPRPRRLAHRVMRVRHEVDHDLVELVGIRVDPRKICRKRPSDLHVVRPQLIREELYRIPCDRV